MLDVYGDILTSAQLPGGEQTKRHDSFLQTVAACRGAMPFEVEVRGLFRWCAMQADNNPEFQAQRAKLRQILQPDAMDGDGTLFDAKTISFCPSRYKPNSWDTCRKAVSARAAKVTREYVTKARNADQQWNGTEEGTQGPIERRLLEFGPVRGLVVGAFGEVNPEVPKLIKRMAEYNAERQWRLMGANTVTEAAATLKARFTRSIGVEAARGLARLRLRNLDRVCGEVDGTLPSRKRAFFFKARWAHYTRFGPRAYYEPDSRDRHRFGPR